MSAASASSVAPAVVMVAVRPALLQSMARSQQAIFLTTAPDWCLRSASMTKARPSVSVIALAAAHKASSSGPGCVTTRTPPEVLTRRRTCE